MCVIVCVCVCVCVYMNVCVLCMISLCLHAVNMFAYIHIGDVCY